MTRMLDHAAYRHDYRLGLTGLRGVAALWVLLYHAWVYAVPREMQLGLFSIQIDVTPLFSAGFVGVDLFFVLSAYLLGARYFRWIEGRTSRPALAPYLLRRARRIFPAYLFQLVLLLLVAAATTLYIFPSPTALLAHLLFYFNLPPLWITQLNGVWWTLPTEFYFYLILPLLALLLNGRTSRWLIVIVITASVAYHYWVFLHFQQRGVELMSVMMGNTLGYLDGFSLGLLASWLSVRIEHRVLPRRWMDFLFVLGWVGLLFSIWTLASIYTEYWTGHPLLYVRNLMIAVPACLIVVATRHGSQLAHVLLSNQFIFFCGVVSYSLYLWHLPVILVLSKSSFFINYSGYPLLAYLLVAVPLSLLCTWLSYHYVEAPFLTNKPAEQPVTDLQKLL